MRANNSSRAGHLEQLAAAIDDALDLLKDMPVILELASVSDQAPGGLLDQCISLCSQQEGTTSEAIRTIHHFACTGGTLISKCLAAMPNTQLLSEVDPLSTLQATTDRPHFSPTDIVTLLRQSTRGVNRELIIELFLNNLAIIYSNSTQIGQRLILRDHAHSHYCVGPSVQERPHLRALVASRFPVLSVVTVRHPLDSFLSLKSNGWLHFVPATLDEYCKRYVAFLQAYEGYPLIRYEDFVNDPQKVMSNVCDSLELPFSDQFTELFSVFNLTGDSGRGGAVIEHRERRPVDREVAEELTMSQNYPLLQELLGYDKE